MKLDEQARQALLADLQGQGFQGSLTDMPVMLQRQAFQTQLRLLGAQVESFYGAEHAPAKQFFRRCLALAGARFWHLRGDGPAFNEPRFIVSRTLKEAETTSRAVRVSWCQVVVDEDAAGLTVRVHLHGKEGVLLRERRFRFETVAKPMRRRDLSA
jgi:hypothetical protein